MTALFGPRLDVSGASFSLWAPTVRQVDVMLRHRGEERCLPMRAAGGGWFEAHAPGAAAGDLYRFRIDDDVQVPDPASRFNPQGVHGASQLVDSAFAWDDWRGRPWHEAVVCELHVGCFTEQGTYAAAEEKLPYLADLGITAIELMPLASFPGARGWGYDGVLLYAPYHEYGTPQDLKRFIQAAHRAGIMVLLDVVYNHFGPDGNYLHLYAQQFFSSRHHTPWGHGMDFDGPHRDVVREFFIQNALYWLEEFRFDGLRLDAVHAIQDDSSPDILQELSLRVRQAFEGRRHVHLILENADNRADLLAEPAVPGQFDAQWNDDFHHAMHVLLTGEVDGYYVAFSHHPIRKLGRVLTEGFAFQGEPCGSGFEDGRGQPSSYLPACAFVNFLQNHDQIGNRAIGERLTALAPVDALEAAASVLLLAPSIPMIFMGEEFGATTPFLYFCDFDGDLARAVTEGRRREFAGFVHFAEGHAETSIPDPNAVSTFLASKLDWASAAQRTHARLHTLYRELIQLRHRLVVPLLPRIRPGSHRVDYHQAHALDVCWYFDGACLRMQANLGAASADMRPMTGELVHSLGALAGDRLGPWAVRWSLESTEQGSDA